MLADGTAVSGDTLEIVVSNALPKVQLSAKGKLDTQQPDSAITYTVTRLSNCPGEIEDVRLAGQNADLFSVRLLEDAATPTAELTMLPGVRYNTGTTYKVQLVFQICGKDVASPVLSVKVNQSALKFTPASGSAVYYQSQNEDLTCTLTATSGLIGDIQISAKTSADFLSALAEDGMSFTCSPDGTGAEVRFQIARPAYLNRNKSYTVYLDVMPQNCAVNKTPTTLKLTVKVLS